MLFNSIEFLVFFPIVAVLFLVIPPKMRYVWLLIASYYFYMSWNPKYAVLILFSTFVTFISGLLIGKANIKYTKQIILAASIIINLALLMAFKYSNFLLQTLSNAAQYCGLKPISWRVDLLLPVGISFYTFQAISYSIDVYRGDIRAEKNFAKYALFVSFFPQLVAGPIERSGNLLRQVQGIKEIKVWDLERIRDGLLLMFWGFFQKLVIADRAAILVGQVYTDYRKYGFLELAIASVLFAFQIYCDFGGYTSIARGAAQVMGFSLMQNFRQPYLAADIKEFWRRWHISLTSWFTDYLYIPLGGSQKGTARKYINIFIVFAVSGLWHGASWHFAVWGILHAFYQIIGDIKRKLKKRFIRNDVSGNSFSRKAEKVIITFLLVDIAWIFFAADSLTHACGILRQMFIVFQTTSVYDIGLDRGNYCVLELQSFL